MATPAGTPILDQHRARLARAFAAHVIELAPESLLDVGCGAGLLLAELKAAGLPARGIDPSKRRLATCRELGLRVARGEAAPLPFADASFDWVVIRHVLHHLEDPAPAVSEAWRVSRTGIVLAEPWCDETLPTQTAMARLDAFTSELLARAGHVHHPYLSAERLIGLAPGGQRSPVIRTYAQPTAVPESEVRTLTRIAAGENELSAEDQTRIEGHARQARAGGVAYLGSCAVFLRRESPSFI